jgi:hypothetical protein
MRQMATVFPDIIGHHRGTHDNFIVIEGRNHLIIGDIKIQMNVIVIIVAESL